jgi:hypothetical protein
MMGRGSGAPTSAVPTLVAAGANVDDARAMFFPAVADATPLHMAAFFNNAAEIEALLACGADPCRRMRFLIKRYTALEYARKQGCEAAAVALKETEVRELHTPAMATVQLPSTKLLIVAAAGAALAAVLVAIRHHRR